MSKIYYMSAAALTIISDGRRGLGDFYPNTYIQEEASHRHNKHISSSQRKFRMFNPTNCDT